MTNSKQTRRKFSPLVGESSPRQPQSENSSKKRVGSTASFRTKAGGACTRLPWKQGYAFSTRTRENLAERWPSRRTEKPPLAFDVGSLPTGHSKASISTGLLEETINRVRPRPFDRLRECYRVSGRHLLKALTAEGGGRGLAHLKAVMTGKSGTDLELFDFKSAEDSKHEEQ